MRKSLKNKKRMSKRALFQNKVKSIKSLMTLRELTKRKRKLIKLKDRLKTKILKTMNNRFNKLSKSLTALELSVITNQRLILIMLTSILIRHPN